MCINPFLRSNLIHSTYYWDTYNINLLLEQINTNVHHGMAELAVLLTLVISQIFSNDTIIKKLSHEHISPL